ncbi:envelope protein M [African pouched rat arterivirus]|uniref:Envelope protein M n=1 Tax=African pouched rat arterivirus TaxID=1965064 RepID=A0A0B5JWP6_9NIDO|nr:envelope protein M [African pouched rat arterivirus]AJG06165.1 envelope protein M [African pouched rat arterivirus]
MVAMIPVDYWCTDTTYGWAVALTLTYTSIILFLLKYTAGNLLFFLHVIACVTISGLIGYVIYQNTSGTVHWWPASFGLASCFIWVVYDLYFIIRYLYRRCLMCKLGPRYAVAPLSFAETSHGIVPVSASSHGVFVARGAGYTLAGNKLVKDIKNIVVNARRAVHRGAVRIDKY